MAVKNSSMNQSPCLFPSSPHPSACFIHSFLFVKKQQVIIKQTRGTTPRRSVYPPGANLTHLTQYLMASLFFSLPFPSLLFFHCFTSAFISQIIQRY